jgi:hypothetical protein
MTSYNPDKVNLAFAVICPELKSKYAVYPIPSTYQGRWLTPSAEEKFEGKPVVLLTDKEDGIKEDYVYCKATPLGRGYYHMLTKVAYVNLYTRIQNEGSGAFLCFGDKKKADQWDTCRRIVYNRSRASRPDDVQGAKQSIDHMEGSKLPGYGLKL